MSQGKGQALWMSETTDKVDNAIPFTGPTNKILCASFQAKKALSFGRCQNFQSMAFKWGSWFKAFQPSNLNHILGLNQKEKPSGRKKDRQDAHKPHFLSFREPVLIYLTIKLFYTFLQSYLNNIGSVKKCENKNQELWYTRINYTA